MPAIVRWVKSRHYDIVIDGANVAYYNNSSFNLNKVATLINRISVKFNKPKILLVFSVCRKKQTRKLLDKWTNVDLFYSKKGTNDDLSWLYVGIYYPNILCITNDKMCDHIYYKFIKNVGRNVVGVWMERHVVPFGFEIVNNRNGNKVIVKLKLPLQYSNRCQHDKDKIHLPIGDDQWLCGRFCQ